MNLPQTRCPQCHRLLFEGIVIAVEVRCPRCHYTYVQDLPLALVREIIILLTDPPDRSNAFLQCTPPAWVS